MASKAERDARLDKLKAATDAWAKKQKEALQQRVSKSKAILKGRTGAERIAQSSIAAGTDLVVAEIDDFLVG